ncbi:hypothetical protein [Saccharopolyspora sp. CA-218241]|uniref:hypothetical protein n=1 Tax=Saccharopolyspora sp. CA-218241 TaxID=3240027 RepID=UPI003D97AC8A
MAGQRTTFAGLLNLSARPGCPDALTIARPAVLCGPGDPGLDKPGTWIMDLSLLSKTARRFATEFLDRLVLTATSSRCRSRARSARLIAARDRRELAAPLFAVRADSC